MTTSPSLIVAPGPLGPVAAAWAAALRDLAVAHPDPSSAVELELRDGEPPSLQVTVLNARNTLDSADVFPRFAISTVALDCWPGVRAAQAWIAAAWAGYMQHEALERVTVRGDRPLDPHAPPYAYDRGLRHGFPPRLTADTLRRTLLLSMDEAAADEIVSQA
ncbi:MAG: hypothetical protein KBD62_32275 [Kofleriaceae bacterium]|nr:hypothetical protein [Kofleriaceae bacterium]